MDAGSLLGWINPSRLLDLAFRARSNAEFLISQEQRLTRGEVFAHVQALAAGLQRLGVTRGERIVSLLPACPEAVYALFLPQMLGTVNVPLNPLLGERELRHILADCGASVVICTRSWYGLDYPALLARLLPDLPALRHVVVCGAGDGDGKVFRPLRDVMASGEPLRRARAAGRDTTVITYTSGTTGQPKGAVHTLGQNWGMAVKAVRPRLGLSSLRCLLLPLPPHHFAGMFGIVTTLLAGGKVVLMDRLDPQRMLELIEKEQVSQIGAAPTIYRWLLRTPGQERYNLTSVRRITFSTEPCPLDLAQALHERLGCSLENMYGTSESRLISWTGPHDGWERAATTVGRPVPGARVRVVDDQRRPLPAGERGEIAVQTSQMMAGYYGDPALTARAIDAEGWFYTGDIGALGEDGYLRLLDRKEDLIIRAGENIYPAEIEQCLRAHPLVRQAAVIGVPSPLAGEAVWAYVQLQPGMALTSMELLGFCRGQLAPFKLPTEVRFVEQLPTTATGKVQRYRLREMAAAEAAP